MEESKINEGFISEFLSNQLFGILSTESQKGPHLVIVSFIVVKHLKEIVFVTPKQTRKYENIMASKRVSLYVDNRSNRMDDIQRLTGIEARGEASLVEMGEMDFYKEFYLSKYPDLKEFLNYPSSAIFKIKVQQFEVINHFQNVSIWDVN